jgi:hypothetical protein
LLFIVGGAFAMSFPIVSIVSFVIAGCFALAAGLASDFGDLSVWGFVAFILAIMSYFGFREKRKRDTEQQQRVR